MKQGLQKMKTLAILTLATISANAQITSSFEDLNLKPNSFLDGSGPNIVSQFTSGDAKFVNSYATGFGGYWAKGFVYSNKTDSVTKGSSNAFSAITGIGYNSSANYVVAQANSNIALTGSSIGKPVKGLYVTNSTYAAISMKQGDAFAKKFGGSTGNDKDWFKLKIQKYENGIIAPNDSVIFYLADFRSDDNTKDYILHTWQYVDLASLGNVDSLKLVLTSSDTGQFGMNTPAYVCIDNVITASGTSDFENLSLSKNSYYKKSFTLNTVYNSGDAQFPNSYTGGIYGDYWSSGFAISSKKDSTTEGSKNIYSSRPAIGNASSLSYAVGKNKAILKLNASAQGKALGGMYITNSTYAALSLKNGDSFAKKFGGASGNDKDWFKLKIQKYLNGVLAPNDSVTFYLADYRFDDNSKDYIIRNWQYVDLKALGNADSLKFTLTSSDVGQYGMNTPAFFCMDDFSMLNTINGLSTTNDFEQSIQIYPNPSNSTLNISSLIQIEKVEVYNQLGSLVYASKTNINDVSFLETGLYYVNITSVNGGLVTKRFLKD